MKMVVWETAWGGGSVKSFSVYSLCVGPRVLKTSFLDTRDLSGVWKKIPDENYYFIMEKKILQVENVSQKRDILRNPCCKLQWECPKIGNAPNFRDFFLYDKIKKFIPDFFYISGQVSSIQKSCF